MPIEEFEETSPEELVQRLQSTPLRRPFAPETLNFMSCLGKRILKDSRFVRSYPDAAAFGFWLRNHRLTSSKHRMENLAELEGGIRVARGLSLHIAPGNVEALFAYSWAVSTLSGCRSVIRVSSRQSELTYRIVDAIEEAASELDFTPNWAFTHWDTVKQEILESFSQEADVLVFWGGDETVRNLSLASRKPHARVLAFPDRESLSLVNGAEFASLSKSERQLVADRLVRDLYSFGQSACSSTRYLLWVGEGGEALNDLISRISNPIDIDLLLEPGEAMKRRTYGFEQVATSETGLDLCEQGRLLVLKNQGMINRKARHPGLGVLGVMEFSNLNEIDGVFEQTDQTLAYFGYQASELRDWLVNSVGNRPRRLVPIGQALDFDDRWDGMNLHIEFTELITID